MPIKPYFENGKRCAKCREIKPLNEFHWRHKHLGKVQSKCIECCKSVRLANYRNRELITAKWRWWQLILQVVEAYGGKCDCCGEREPLFLEIDHVNGGGRKLTKPITGKFYRWLRDNGFPKDGLRLLCANCNRGRWRNHGVCPHLTKLRKGFDEYRRRP